VLSGSAKPDVRNAAVFGRTLPVEAAGTTNIAVDERAFVDAASHDYRPAAESRLIDSGTTIADVTTDRAGVMRPRGRAYDVGAYEEVERKK
jgi:hypothetical protein